jgi:predicted RNase H-like HicB family nuclease
MFKRLLEAIKRAAGSGTPVSATHWDEENDALHAEIEFRVLVTEDEIDGGYVVECLNLPGCMSQGETIDQAIENIGEAIAGVLATRFERSLRAQAHDAGKLATYPPEGITVPLALGSPKDRVPA